MAYSHLSLYEDFKNTVCGQIESTDWYKSMVTNQDKFNAYEACSISILDAAENENEEAFLYESLNILLDEKAIEFNVERQPEM